MLGMTLPSASICLYVCLSAASLGYSGQTWKALRGWQCLSGLGLCFHSLGAHTGDCDSGRVWLCGGCQKPHVPGCAAVSIFPAWGLPACPHPPFPSSRAHGCVWSQDFPGLLPALFLPPSPKLEVKVWALRIVHIGCCIYSHWRDKINRHKNTNSSRRECFSEGGLQGPMTPRGK